MKARNKIIFILFLVLALVSCEKDNLDKEVLVKTHTISQFLNEFATETGVMFPVRPNSGAANLYSVDLIKAEENIVIEGIVVSSDTAGNVYKAIFIQDVVNPEIGLKISIDAAALSGVIPLGQRLLIKCNDLAVGKYAGMYQLGVAYFNNSDTTVVNEARKRGYEPGRIPYPMFKTRIQYEGMPDESKIVVHTMTINQIKNAGKSVHGRLVRINNVNFDSSGANVIFAEDTKGIGYPTSRNITDGTGTIAVSTSEYARFARKLTPTQNQKGDIIALVGWYRDKESNSGDFQLVIRSLDDLIGFK